MSLAGRALVLGALCLVPGGVRAQEMATPAQVDTAPTLAELTSLQAALGSAEATERKRAFDALRSLGAELDRQVVLERRDVDAGAVREQRRAKRSAGRIR